MIIGGYDSPCPIYLFWCDVLEVIKFGNPIFASHMRFDPHRLWYDELKSEGIYSEYMTGDYAWQAQVRCQILDSESGSSPQRTNPRMVQPSYLWPVHLTKHASLQ